MDTLCQLDYWRTYVVPEGYSHDKIPDLTGKVAIVTGANTGLGYASTVALAANGAHVIMACRSKERAFNAIEKAKAEIKQNYPNAPEPKLEFLELDLNDMAKTRKSAQTFLAKNLPIHILMCNSGIMATPFALSADGIETQFAVNHMGHYVFTMTLLDRIKASQPSRIVILSSGGHEWSDINRFDLETLNVEKTPTFTRYGRSKIANILFSSALARRLENEKVYVNSLHPGYVKTELMRNAGDVLGQRTAKIGHAIGSALIGLEPQHACLTQLYLATSPEVESNDIRGKYYMTIAHHVKPNRKARDEEAQEDLMRFSEKLVKEKIGGL